MSTTGFVETALVKSVALLVALHSREEFLRLRRFAGAFFRARPRRTSPRTAALDAVLLHELDVLPGWSSEPMVV